MDQQPEHSDVDRPERLSCTFCKQAAMFREPRVAGLTRRDPLVCLTCGRLYQSASWDGLALRWLQNRPEDWVSDVSVFLEFGNKS